MPRPIFDLVNSLTPTGDRRRRLLPHRPRHLRRDDDAVPPRSSRRAMATLAVVATVGALLSVSTVVGSATTFGETRNIWVDRSTIMSLPTKGAAWEGIADAAKSLGGSAKIVDNSNDHDVETLAGALYAVRMNDGDMKDEVEKALRSAIGSESGGSTLGLGRSLQAYVIAADILGYRDRAFVDWVDAVRTKELDRTLVSTHEDRPNNWGTHASASRIAADLYLGDTADLAKAVAVFRGWLGDRSAYDDFKYGDLDWQADPDEPVGINPPGAELNGRSVDGVLPDDQRRGGDFKWPPPKENYVWEAMQGISVSAVLLHRAGYPAFQWSDGAIGRAADWLYNEADYPAEGDDLFIPYLLDYGLGTSYSDGVTARSGKGMGFTDWTHATPSPDGPPPTSPTTKQVTTSEVDVTTSLVEETTTTTEETTTTTEAPTTSVTAPKPTPPPPTPPTSPTTAPDDRDCIVIVPPGGDKELEEEADENGCRVARWEDGSD